MSKTANKMPKTANDDNTTTLILGLDSTILHLYDMAHLISVGYSRNKWEGSSEEALSLMKKIHTAIELDNQTPHTTQLDLLKLVSILLPPLLHLFPHFDAMGLNESVKEGMEALYNHIHSTDETKKMTDQEYVEKCNMMKEYYIALNNERTKALLSAIHSEPCIQVGCSKNPTNPTLCLRIHHKNKTGKLNFLKKASKIPQSDIIYT